MSHPAFTLCKCTHTQRRHPEDGPCDATGCDCAGFEPGLALDDPADTLPPPRLGPDADRPLGGPIPAAAPAPEPDRPEILVEHNGTGQRFATSIPPVIPPPASTATDEEVETAAAARREVTRTTDALAAVRAKSGRAAELPSPPAVRTTSEAEILDRASIVKRAQREGSPQIRKLAEKIEHDLARLAADFDDWRRTGAARAEVAKAKEALRKAEEKLALALGDELGRYECSCGRWWPTSRARTGHLRGMARSNPGVHRAVETTQEVTRDDSRDERRDSRPVLGL